MDDSNTDVDCAVVIVTYNSAGYIGGLLRSLPLAAPGLTLQIIVVDNGSADATVNVARQFQDVTCIPVGKNLGYAGGINLGRGYVSSDAALLVLNPDVRFEPGALGEMYSALERPDVGIVVPMLLDPMGCRYPSLRREPSLTRALGDALFGRKFACRPGWLSQMIWNEAPYHVRHAVDWATGAVVLISAACDAAVGPWDERFFLYSEETDYAARARSAGFRVEYVPTAQVRHRGGGSGGSQALVALMAVSRIRYMEKRGHWPRTFRGVVALHELLRSSGAAHRSALRTVLKRSSWPDLIASLQVPPASDLVNLR